MVQGNPTIQKMAFLSSRVSGKGDEEEGVCQRRRVRRGEQNEPSRATRFQRRATGVSEMRITDLAVPGNAADVCKRRMDWLAFQIQSASGVQLLLTDAEAVRVQVGRAAYRRPQHFTRAATTYYALIPAPCINSNFTSEHWL